MSAYFRRVETQIDPTWHATSSAGNFVAAIIKAGEVWQVQTGKSNNPTVHLDTPSLEQAMDYVLEDLMAVLPVR